MPSYAQIPEFGQYVEYITQAQPVMVDGQPFYGLVFNRIPINIFFADPEQDQDRTINTILTDYVKVFRIVTRVLSLTGIDLDNVIPTTIRTKINNWLTNHGYPTVPADWTYRQLLEAIKARV